MCLHGVIAKYLGSAVSFSSIIALDAVGNYVQDMAKSGV